MKTVFDNSRELPVHDTVDILVVGGGVAGFAAALAAGRLGMSF